MTPEQIQQFASQCKHTVHAHGLVAFPDLAEFAALVAAHEREKRDALVDALAEIVADAEDYIKRGGIYVSWLDKAKAALAKAGETK